jgi:hypothetical protein
MIPRSFKLYDQGVEVAIDVTFDALDGVALGVSDLLVLQISLQSIRLDFLESLLVLLKNASCML